MLLKDSIGKVFLKYPNEREEYMADTVNKNSE